VIKLRRVRWAGHIARIGEMRNAYNILTVKPEDNTLLRRQGVDGNIMSEWASRKMPSPTLMCFLVFSFGS
jgi:hypothetical protein